MRWLKKIWHGNSLEKKETPKKPKKPIFRIFSLNSPKKYINSGKTTFNQTIKTVKKHTKTCVTQAKKTHKLFLVHWNELAQVKEVTFTIKMPDFLPVKLKLQTLSEPYAVEIERRYLEFWKYWNWVVFKKALDIHIISPLTEWFLEVTAPIIAKLTIVGKKLSNHCYTLIMLVVLRTQLFFLWFIPSASLVWFNSWYKTPALKWASTVNLYKKRLRARIAFEYIRNAPFRRIRNIFLTMTFIIFIIWAVDYKMSLIAAQVQADYEVYLEEVYIENPYHWHWHYYWVEYILFWMFFLYSYPKYWWGLKYQCEWWETCVILRCEEATSGWDWGPPEDYW